MNAELKKQINDCSSELKDIDNKIKLLPFFDKTRIYLTNYALIRTCGTIEHVCKFIIADFFLSLPMPQIHNYLEKTIRNAPLSATYDNMSGLLGKFDENWQKNFKKYVNARSDKEKLCDSLRSLVNNRHTFAHGGVPTATFQDIKNYYEDAIIMIDIFDSVIA